MSNNLPDDVSASDIDDAYGGEEVPVTVEVELGVTVTEKSETNHEDQLMDCVEEAVLFDDFHIFPDSVEVAEVVDGNIAGSVTIEFTFETVNQNHARKIAREELEENIKEDSDWEVQVISISSVRR